MPKVHMQRKLIKIKDENIRQKRLNLNIVKRVKVQNLTWFLLNQLQVQFYFKGNGEI